MGGLTNDARAQTSTVGTVDTISEASSLNSQVNVSTTDFQIPGTTKASNSTVSYDLDSLVFDNNSTVPKRADFDSFTKYDPAGSAAKRPGASFTKLDSTNNDSTGFRRPDFDSFTKYNLTSDTMSSHDNTSKHHNSSTNKSNGSFDNGKTSNSNNRSTRETGAQSVGEVSSQTANGYNGKRSGSTTEKQGGRMASGGSNGAQSSVNNVSSQGTSGSMASGSSVSGNSASSQNLGTGGKNSSVSNSGNMNATRQASTDKNSSSAQVSGGKQGQKTGKAGNSNNDGKTSGGIGSSKYIDSAKYNTMTVDGVEVKLEEIDLSSLTEEQIQSLLGQMSQEQYNLFIKGVEKYYSDQIKYFEGLIDGTKDSDGYQQMLDDIDMFYAEKDFFQAITNAKQSTDSMICDRVIYYQDYGEVLDLFAESDINFEQFQNMTYEEKIDFLSKYDDTTKNCIESYQQTKEMYNEEIAERFKEYGISSYEELAQAKEDLSRTIEQLNEAIKMAKNTRDSAKYDYLNYMKEYADFHEREITETDLRTLDEDSDMYDTNEHWFAASMAGMTGQGKIYSYTQYHEKHPDVSPIDYIKMVEEKNPKGLYTINGIGNYDDLKSIMEVSDKIPAFEKTYQYLYSKDPERAQQFLEDCQYEINNVKGQLRAEAFLSTLGEKDGKNDTLDAVANELGVTTEGLIDGLTSFGEGAYYSVEALLTGLGIMEENRTMSAEEYKRMYILEALLSMKQKEEAGLIVKDASGEFVTANGESIIDFTKEYSGAFLSNNYEISQGIGNMLPSIALSAVCPIAGSVSMGVSAGGNAYHGAMVEGYSYTRALLYGIASGSTEAITERLLGGLPGLSDVEVNSVKTWLKAAVKEGNEEVYQNFIDKAYRSMILGEELDIPKTKEEFYAELKEEGKTWVYGAITAGILQSPNLGALLINGNSNSQVNAQGPEITEQTIGEESLSNNSENEAANTKEVESQDASVNKDDLSKQHTQPASVPTSVEQKSEVVSNVELSNEEAQTKQKKVDDTAEGEVQKREWSNGRLSNEPLKDFENLSGQEALEEITRPGSHFEVDDLTESQVLELLESKDLTVEQLTAKQALALVKNSSSAYSLKDLTPKQISVLSKSGDITAGETLQYVQNGVESGRITKENVVSMFTDLVGSDLAGWALTVDAKYTIYTELLSACSNADIKMNELQQSIQVMNAMEDYYLNAANLELESGQKTFDTYRTHGIVHVFDVLTESINACQAMKKIGVEGIDVNAVMLSAVMHDTGMSGGKQILLSIGDNGELIIKTQEAQKDGTTYRESHSFNSGVNILENYEVLRKMGYSDTQIAEAALLAFGHSKSNSGLRPLSGNEAGWSFAIQALDEATKGSKFDFLQALVKAGIITSTDTTLSEKEIEVKCPKGYKTNEDGTIMLDKDGSPIKNGEGGKKKGKIPQYQFSEGVIEKLSYEALTVRIGDALTNNDHALVNQYLGEITFNTTDYSNQYTAQQVLEALIASKTVSGKTNSKNIIETLLETDDGLMHAGFAETQHGENDSVTFEVNGKTFNGSQPFVLGENNQTYSLNTTENGVEVVVTVKDAEHVPFCTLFAIDERAGELISKGEHILTTDSDGKTLSLVIEIDENTSPETRALYEQYVKYYEKKYEGNIDIELREISIKNLSAQEALAEITKPNAHFEIGDLTESQVLELLESKDLTVEQLTAKQALALVKNSSSAYSLKDLTPTQVSELSKSGDITAGETLEYVQSGVESGRITKENAVTMFTDLVGSDLAGWALNVNAKYTIYTELLRACSNADIKMNELQQSLQVMKAMEDFYIEAANLELESGQKIFDTYRTHGIVHVFDVLTESINACQAMKKVGVDGIDINAVMLSAVMHDTGMSGGQQILLSIGDNGELIINTQEAQKDGTTYRESHSFNSGVYILENYKVLMQMGYSNTQIAEAALLAFGHSKSNSGLKPLSGNAAGWSFAIQALDKATQGSDFDFLQELVKAGIITSTDTTLSEKEIEVKCPKKYKTDDKGKILLDEKGNPIKNGEGGKKKGKIPQYEFSEGVIEKLSYEALAVRIGDALTNNDHALVNQYLGEITFDETDYSNQYTAQRVLESLIASKTVSDKTNSKNIIETLLETEDGLMKAGFAETKHGEKDSVTFKVNGKTLNDSQPFVLGENNQTYSLNTTENGVEVVVTVKDAEHVPFCTLFAIDERAGELTSKGIDILTTDSDGKTLSLVIEIDENTSPETRALYEQYVEYYEKKYEGNIDIELREI